MALQLGCAPSPEGLIITGPCGGTGPKFISNEAAQRCEYTNAWIDKPLALDVNAQEACLILHGSLQRLEDHLLRVVPWEQLEDSLIPADERKLQAFQHISSLGDAEMTEHVQAQIRLPHRHGGMGIPAHTSQTAAAAYLAASALT